MFIDLLSFLVTAWFTTRRVKDEVASLKRDPMCMCRAEARSMRFARISTQEAGNVIVLMSSVVNIAVACAAPPTLLPLPAAVENMYQSGVTELVRDHHETVLC